MTSSGPHALWLKVYHRGEGNSWSLFAEIANPHHDRILCLAVNPQKNEVITTDGVGLVKVWGLIEKTSPLNNNESVSNDETYTWTCCHSFVHSEEPVTGISYSSDGTVYALSNLILSLSGQLIHTHYFMYSLFHLLILLFICILF